MVVLNSHPTVETETIDTVNYNDYKNVVSARAGRVFLLLPKSKVMDFVFRVAQSAPEIADSRSRLVGFGQTCHCCGRKLRCSGYWLCDLTLERYKVGEKKVSKKRPRGLKALGNMDTDSE